MRHASPFALLFLLLIVGIRADARDPANGNASPNIGITRSPRGSGVYQSLPGLRTTAVGTGYVVARVVSSCSAISVRATQLPVFMQKRGAGRKDSPNVAGALEFRGMPHTNVLLIVRKTVHGFRVLPYGSTLDAAPTEGAASANANRSSGAVLDSEGYGMAFLGASRNGAPTAVPANSFFGKVDVTVAYQ